MSNDWAQNARVAEIINKVESDKTQRNLDQRKPRPFDEYEYNMKGSSKKAPGNPVQAQICKVAEVATEAINANEKLKNELRKLYKLSEGAFQLELGEVKESVEKSGSVIPPEHMRIRRMFGHRDTTLPDSKSRKAFSQLKHRLKDQLSEQIDTMERFYSFRSKRAATETNYWSGDDVTLMNNWDAKMATAYTFLKDKPSSVAKEIVENLPPEPKNWQTELVKQYPTFEPEKWTWKSFFKAYPDVCETLFLQ